MIGIEARLLAGLGLALTLWFGWHRLTESYREEGRQECRDAAAYEYKENSRALTKIAEQSRADSARLAADAGAARAASDRLRGAVAGSGLVIRSASDRGGEGKQLSETERLSGELLETCRATTEWAECLATKGAACEASYDAVSK